MRNAAATPSSSFLTTRSNRAARPTCPRIQSAGWLLGLAIALAAGGARLAAAEPEHTAQDDDLRIRGIFDSVLPRTEHKNSLRLIVHPHLGDITHSDYLRTALGFRYGLTRNWEGTFETEAYFAHGLKNEPFFSKYGFSSYHLGTKYNLGDRFGLGWDTSIGIDWYRPAGNPPVELTDGLEHFAPFVSVSRQLESHPAWRVFGAVGYDKVEKSGVLGQLRRNDLGGDAMSMSAGFLYQRGLMTYTLEGAYATMHLTKDLDRERFTLRPGFIWVLPPRFTPYGREGKWLLGFGLDLTKGPDGFDMGASAKLRVNFDLKRLLGRHKTDR